MTPATIDKIQLPLFFLGLGSLMVGFGAKFDVVRVESGGFINLAYFLVNMPMAPMFVWIYWLSIALFLISFITLMILQYLKTRS